MAQAANRGPAQTRTPARTPQSPKSHWGARPGKVRDRAKGSSVMQVFAVAAAADVERKEGSEGPPLMRPSFPAAVASASRGGVMVLVSHCGGLGFGLHSEGHGPSPAWWGPWPWPHVAAAGFTCPWRWPRPSPTAAALLQLSPCFWAFGTSVAAPRSDASRPPLTLGRWPESRQQPTTAQLSPAAPGHCHVKIIF